MATERNIEVIDPISAYSKIVEIDGKKCLAKIISSANDGLVEALQQSLVSALLQESLPSTRFVFEVFKFEDCICVPRDYVEGRSCGMIPMESSAECLRAIIEIAKTVHEAHEMNCVHGNLTPENIIQEESGNFVIVDWRVREFYKIAGAQNPYGQGLQYLAPEQILGTLDVQCDVYALGMILCKMLTGRTPFDGLPEDTLIQAIQQGSGEDLRILGVPEQFLNVVETAISADTNSRYQNVAQFIKACEESLRAEGVSGEEGISASDGGEVVEDEPIRTNKRFVLVGHTGAGKTVLAAGLYSTFSRQKGLSVEAADEQTKQLVNNLKSQIETSSWPAATTGGKQKLLFRIAHDGDGAELEFDEYMGERTNDVQAYIRDILKIPDGALLLMNPGGIQFHSRGEDDTPQELATRRNKMLSDLESIIDYLFKLPKRPFVGLVVTASDRLETDLKDFKPEFDRYVEKIETALDARSKTWWRRFDISVCGKLNDQKNPRLAPEKIEEPFLWLLDCYNHRVAVQRRVRLAKFAMGTLATLALTAVGWWGVDWYRAEEPLTRMKACQIAYTGKTGEDDLRNRRKTLVDLRADYCSEKHIAIEKNIGSRIAPCSETCGRFFLFPDRKEAHLRNLEVLENQIDLANSAYLKFMVEKAVKNATDDNFEVVGEVVAWSPFRENGLELRKTLAKKCETELLPARERYLFNELCKQLIAVSSSPEKGMPKDLEAGVASFLAMQPALSQDERAKCVKAVAENLVLARKSVFAYSVNVFSRKVKQFSSSQTQDLKRILEEWNVFRTQKTNGIPSNFVVEQRDALATIVAGMVRDFLNEKCSKFHDRQMNSDEILQENFVAELEKYIYPEIPEFSADFRMLVKTRVDGTYKQWNEMMRGRVDSFISRTSGLVATSMLKEFKDFYYENETNPYMRLAEEFAIKKAWDYLDSITQPKEWKNTKSEYMRVRELCVAVRSTPGELMKTQRMYRFANAYIDWLDGYSRTVKVLEGRIKSQGRSRSNDPLYVTSTYDSQGNRVAGRSPVLKNGWYSYPDTTWTFRISKPWETYTLTMNFKDRGIIFDVDCGSSTYTFSFVGCRLRGRMTEKWGNDLELEVDILDGKNIWEVWDESFIGN